MKLLQLFISFLKIGAFSFGGGYAMLPLIKKEVIEIRGWITITEFIDILAVVEMTPGPIAVNSATFLGYEVAGVLGSIVATTAVVLPSFVIILIIAHFLSKFRDSPYVDWAFRGIRPVILGLVASAAITVSMDAIVNIPSLIIGVVIFYLITFKELHPILGIIIAGAAGALLF